MIQTVTAARAQADTAAVTVSSEVFALIGTRSALRGGNLDRHWRNARIPEDHPAARHRALAAAERRAASG